MEELKELVKAIKGAEDTLEKSHVKEYQRRTKSGGMTTVHEHEDSRSQPSPSSNLERKEMTRRMKDLLAKYKDQGYTMVDAQHFRDGISVDADAADHHHYFLENKEGKRAAVYHHTQRNGLHTVGESNNGEIPAGPSSKLGTKYLIPIEKWKD